MSDNVEKQISELVDGELSAGRAREVAGLIAADPGLRVRWERYHLIGDLIRGTADARALGLAERVMGALQREAVPIRARRRARISRPVLGVAAAAAVAALAVAGVLSIGGGKPGAERAEPPQVAQVNEVRAVRTGSGTRMEEAVRQQLRAYVADHDAQLAVSGSNGMLPYVRLADFEAPAKGK